MHPRFHPRLINGPFDDPGLFIPFLFESQAILFDLGDNQVLTSRDILKISHVFVSHTHMDHFIGFDRILRLALGREKNLHLFGPRQFLSNVEGKLAAYSWNLVANYPYRLKLRLTEIHHDYQLSRTYLCQNEFIPTDEAERKPFTNILVEAPAFKVSAAILDHDIPCLGFAIKERFHVNINKDALNELDLQTGPWLTDFKQALYAGADPASEIEVITGSDMIRHFTLGELADHIAMVTPGQKISYIADVAYTPANADKIISLAQDSDHLFIEAAFLDAQQDLAAEKHHLTARQAGELAACCGARQFTIFHFSPRYLGQEDLLYQEAEAAYAENS
ncbi:MAG: MBL fold metallo-hydrolase [Desulfobacterales bacterium]|nr:MBL fold metallo-hydrolase [Desulfobacterales bacterium]